MSDWALRQMWVKKEMISLRDYQEEALEHLFRYWETNAGLSPIICAPTGSGKSLIIAEFCRRVCTETPHVKIMVLAHVRELLTQNESELRSLWPDASTGIYSAGLGKKQTEAQITFAGIQSVYEKVYDFGKVDIVIIDECFPYNTTVETNMGKLKIGDIVEHKLSVNILTHTGKYKKILNYIKKLKPVTMVCVIHEKGRVECTPNHKFLTKNRGWIKAEDLNCWDYIYRYDGTPYTRTPKQSINGEMDEIISRRTECYSIGSSKEKESVASRFCSYSKPEANNPGEFDGRYGYKLSKQNEQLSEINNQTLFETVRVCGLEIFGVKEPMPVPATTDKERGVWRDELHGDKPMPTMSGRNIQHCKDKRQDKIHGTMVGLINRANRFCRMVYGRWVDRTSRAKHKHIYGKGVCGGRRFGCIVVGKTVGVEFNCISRAKRIQNRDIQTPRCINSERNFDDVRSYITNDDVQNSVYDLEVEDDHTYTANGIVVHNCHLVPRDADTRYGTFFKDIKTANPHVAIFGLSASPYRMDSGMLHTGRNALFDGIAYSVDMKKLIKDGYLVNVISKGGVRKIDLTNVHLQAGDYKASELAHAADNPVLIELAVNEIVELGKDRKAWLLFCSGVEHALHVAAEVQKHGIKCEVVTGDTPKEQRDKLISDFKEGNLRAIANVGVMTTGVNIPRCDLIALLTSTMSTGKYIQMIGRSMRPYPFKDDALLLDYGGNCLRHGPIDSVDPIKTKDIFNVEKKVPPLKECSVCRVILHARTMICPACGYEFPVTAPHGTESYDGAVMSDQEKPFIVEVASSWISRHKKGGKPDSVKVAFYDAMEKEYAMWLSLDIPGYAGEKARAIVKQFGGNATTVDMALKEQYDWKPVTHIQVKKDGKWDRITGFMFGERVAKQETL